MGLTRHIHTGGLKMIVTRGRGREVIVRHRDDEGRRITTKIKEYRPYFFLKNEDANLTYAVKKEEGYKGVYGEDLTKIIVADPQAIYDFKKNNPHFISGRTPFTI